VTDSAVLAVYAHPDDESLCAAGTLALCAARGERVTLLCATRGEHGPISSAELATHETLAAVRERELRACCETLGLEPPIFLDLPDGGVSWAAAEQGTLSQLVRCIRQLRPRVVLSFGPDGLYGHSDHTAIAELTDNARRLAADPHYVVRAAPQLAACRLPRLFCSVWTEEFVRELLQALTRAGKPSQLWSLRPEQFALHADAITASVDVSTVLEQKLRAMRCHRTQLADDHVLTQLSLAEAQRFLSVEHFRCADDRPGDPLDCL
jgi:LmbE family N-acetylglucosaminyl deacetylase